MIRHDYLQEIGVNLVSASPPFSLDELYDLLVGLERAPQDPGRGLPVLMDLRSVDLSLLTEADIRRHLMRKSTLDPKVTQVPCAYVVRDLQDAARVRMATVFSDLSGVSSELRSFVTLDMPQALVWLLNPPADPVQQAAPDTARPSDEAAGGAGG